MRRSIASLRKASKHFPGSANWPDAQALARLLDRLPGIVYRSTLDRGTMEFVSAGCRAMTGFDPHDLQHNRVFSFIHLIHPHDREQVRVKVHEAIASDRPFNVTYRIRCRNGMLRWVWDRGSAVRFGPSHVDGIEGFITDISNQRELEETLEDTNRLFRTLTEQTLTGVFVLRGTTIEYTNPRFAALFGASPDDLATPRSFLDLVHEEDRQQVAVQLASIQWGDCEVANFKFRGVRPSGDRIDLQAQINSIEIDDRPASVGVALDITERVRWERRAHQAQKMESLGQMAAGVAHDFNNVLTVIKTAGQLLAQASDLGPDSERDIRDLLDAVERGATLSRQLMTFGRLDPPALTELLISLEIENLMPMLERITGKDIAVQFTHEEDLPLLELDPADIEQVLLNLVINATDAMPFGGVVRIEVRQVPGGPECVPLHNRSKPQVAIVVQDTGIGIEPKLISRLFEPYFTTKGDRGTGLGLSNVWRITAEAGGCVTVESSVGKGSTFTVYFPVDPE